MKIKGKLNTDVVGFHIKRNQAHDGREAFVDIEIGFKQDEAAKKVGEDFATLAFSSMRILEDDDGGQSFKHLVDSVKPGKNVVFEQHRIAFDELPEFDAQPELLSVKTVDGEAKVVAKIRLSVDVGKKALINALVSSVGETLKAKFDPQQGTFEFKGKDANDDGADDEDDGGVPDEDEPAQPEAMV